MPEQRRIVTAVPENSETPLENVRSWVTPTRLFFVRNHFDVPQIDLETWRLSWPLTAQRMGWPLEAWRMSWPLKTRRMS